MPLDLSRSIPFYVGVDRPNKRVWFDSRCHERSTLYIINFQIIGLVQVNFHESDIFRGLTDKNLCHSHENQLVQF